jgi:hypothetical protein
VRSSADALEVVALVMSRPPRPETIAFVLDGNGCGTTVLVVDGTELPDSVIDVVERVAEAAELAGAAGIVVASVRPVTAADSAAVLADGDVDRWCEASDIAADHGVELLEWYVVGPHGISCPRELFGEPPRWRD